MTHLQLNLLTQSSDPRERLEGMAEELLAECIAKGVDPVDLVLELEYRQLCDTLDQCTVAQQKEFVARLLRKYLSKREVFDV